jgi:signal transduction histidine kinase
MLEDGVSVTLAQDIEGLSARYDSVGLTVDEIEQIDDDERLVRLQGSLLAVNDVDAALMPTPADESTVRVVIDGEPYLVRSYDLDDDLVVVVGRTLDQAADAVGATSLALSVAISIALVLIGIVIWVVVRRALAPVERMRKLVDNIDESGLHRRVPASGVGDELDRLAGTLNGMLDRLEQAQLTQRRFVSDASHELRSPLATLRQHAELARAHPQSTAPGELAELVLAESERMQHLVEALLLLARLDERRGPGTLTSVDLDDLALAEVRRVRALGVVNVDASEIAPARVQGNERLLATALRNLVENARRHARAHVRISLEEHTEGTVVLDVDDDGAGIPVADRERVFERFTRLDEGRARDAGGSGLGLAIVREVVRAHDGDVVVYDSDLGGARFVVTLPAAFTTS